MHCMCNLCRPLPSIKILPLIFAVHPEFDEVGLGAFDRCVVIAGEFADCIRLRIRAVLADAGMDALRLQRVDIIEWPVAAFARLPHLISHLIPAVAVRRAALSDRAGGKRRQWWLALPETVQESTMRRAAFADGKPSGQTQPDRAFRLRNRICRPVHQPRHQQAK